jgi:hypothetical protein
MEAATSRERQRTHAIAEEYRSRDYEVIEQLSPEQLPEFLAGYRPDSLARRGDEATIVVVKSRSSLAIEPQITELARLLPRKPHWNFELAMVGEGEQFTTPEGARLFARDEYNFLTKVMKYRNALVHGFKTIDFDPALVTELISLTKRLLQSTSAA